MVRASLSVEAEGRRRPDSIRERLKKRRRQNIKREMSMEVSLKIAMWLADV